MKEQLQERANAVKAGAKTLRFWLTGSIESLIGGGFGSISSILGLLAADQTGTNIGDSLDIKTIGIIFAVGALAKLSMFLKDFDID